jgi:SAM-dependent methyltransferase
VNNIECLPVSPASPAMPPVPVLEAVKASQRAAWASADCAMIGTTLQIVGESLCEAIDLSAGAKVLDVASGNGNCSLAAARRWCNVTSTDYVPALLEDGRRRAEAERLAIRFQVADAEALPFAANSFDVVLSSFGVMFAPDHDRAANELLRVCRPGGTIGLANWKPYGFIGGFFTIVARYAPLHPALASPVQWGLEDHIDRLFRHAACDLRMEHRTFVLRYRSAEHWLEVFRTWYGPLHQVFADLPVDAQTRLERDLLGLADDFNQSGGSTLKIPAEYLEAVIVKR